MVRYPPQPCVTFVNIVCRFVTSFRAVLKGGGGGLKKVEKFSRGALAVQCVREAVCKLWDLQGRRNFPPPKFSPAK